MAEPAVPLCSGAGKGPDPSLSVASSASCGLRLELPEGSGHAGGLLPSAIGPLPTHCNPGKAPRPLPLSTFPFARRPRVGGGLLHHGLGALCPATHPKTRLVRATSTHPPSKSAPQPVPHHGPVPPPASALPQSHPTGPSITQPALAPWQPPPRLVLLPQLLRDPSAGLVGTCSSGCGCSAGMAP